jgi:hypothetical protein
LFWSNVLWFDFCLIFCSIAFEVRRAEFFDRLAGLFERLFFVDPRRDFARPLGDRSLVLLGISRPIRPKRIELDVTCS